MKKEIFFIIEELHKSVRENSGWKSRKTFTNDILFGFSRPLDFFLHGPPAHKKHGVNHFLNQNTSSSMFKNVISKDPRTLFNWFEVSFSTRKQKLLKCSTWIFLKLWAVFWKPDGRNWVICGLKASRFGKFSIFYAFLDILGLLGCQNTEKISTARKTFHFEATVNSDRNDRVAAIFMNQNWVAKRKTKDFFGEFVRWYFLC